MGGGGGGATEALHKQGCDGMLCAERPDGAPAGDQASRRQAVAECGGSGGDAGGGEWQPHSQLEQRAAQPPGPGVAVDGAAAAVGAGGGLGSRPAVQGALLMERHIWAVDVEQAAAERERLAPLWAAAAPLADRFSAARIGERFAGIG